MQGRLRQVQPTLTNGVVVLTPFREEDAPIMVEWDHDTGMARWFDFPSLPDEAEHLEHVRSVIAKWHAAYAEGTTIAWAVRRTGSEQLISWQSFVHDLDGGTDASYATHPDYRRQGLATRALRLISQWALVGGGFARVVLELDARNVASAAVARAVGFVEIERRPEGGRLRERRVARRRRVDGTATSVAATRIRSCVGHQAGASRSTVPIERLASGHGENLLGQERDRTDRRHLLGAPARRRQADFCPFRVGGCMMLRKSHLPSPCQEPLEGCQAPPHGYWQTCLRLASATHCTGLNYRSTVARPASEGARSFPEEERTPAHRRWTMRRTARLLVLGLLLVGLPAPAASATTTPQLNTDASLFGLTFPSADPCIVYDVRLEVLDFVKPMDPTQFIWSVGVEDACSGAFLQLLSTIGPYPPIDQSAFVVDPGHRGAHLNVTVDGFVGWVGRSAPPQSRLNLIGRSRRVVISPTVLRP